MSKIRLGVVFIFILCCSDKRTEKTVSHNSPTLLKKGITSDTCSFCSIDSFLVKSAIPQGSTKINIDFPVAIEMLDRVRLIHRYERDNYDTLMKVFKMKRAGDRNEIYSHYDLYGYYTRGIKPVLIKNKVTIIDTIRNERYVTIKDSNRQYIVDLSYYRRNDGVLIFKPGKKPVYWTMKKDQENCSDYYVFPNWYFHCR